MNRLVATLDKQMRLVGSKIKKPGKHDVVLPDQCDLALDGRYKWDGERFVPLGHGFGPVVAKPPVSEAAVLYALIEALGDKAPTDAVLWAEWYEQNLKVRDEELAILRVKQKVRK